MGGVVHFEIPADDEDRARNFYHSNFGWSFQVIPESEYSLAQTSGQQPGSADAPPTSINGGIYRRNAGLNSVVVTIEVADIDAALQSINASGGSTLRGKMEVPAAAGMPISRIPKEMSSACGRTQVRAVPEGRHQRNRVSHDA
ncbi:VOC family protein [Paenarthrobacter ureafaciens]|uniref:VOC family protein n=1 Tax=Paenarthrobacter ureafaciens TaxID=37931 RepID=UPI000397081B|nr:VOC family protein [Paenarthrobacter ureafaciens]AOY71615.1 hypothetical protein ARZXY2_2071 [Arthrobacter sp. ZXY-2]